MQTTDTATLSDPWQSCLKAMGELPGAMLAELEEAWNSLAEYETELSNWYRQLTIEQQRLSDQTLAVAASPVAEVSTGTTPNPMRSPEQEVAPVEPPPQVMRTVSAAARQFAALRRQRSGQRPLQ